MKRKAHDLKAAVEALNICESAQARHAIAMYLAEAVESELTARKVMGLAEDAAEVVRGREIAAACRRAAVWEYLDREIASITAKVKAYLNL
jgi:hypothetical protein